MSERTAETRRLAAQSGGLSGLLTRDVQSKLLALIFAALTWVYINREITDEVELLVPVRVENRSTELLVTDVRPARLRVVVVGPKEKLFALEGAALSRGVTLTDRDSPLAAGETQTTLALPGSDFVKLPLGVVPKKLPQVEVRLVRSAVRSLRVRPQLVGEPAAGYRVARVELDPNEVRVQAPAELLERLRELQAGAIDVTGRTAADSPISTTVELPTAHDGLPLQAIDGRRVSVKVFVERQVATRRLQLRKRTVYFSAPAGFPYRVNSIDPASVDVWLEGPPEGADAARDPRALRVFVELDSEDPDTLAKHHRGIHYPLRVRGLPPGYRLLRFEVRVGESVREQTKVSVKMEAKQPK